MSGADQGLAGDEEVARAGALLRAGRLVGLPTETVYGLAADGLNERAVAQIFKVKGRPERHPVILHLSSPQEIDWYGQDVPDQARMLAQAFWPGPLTMILRRRSLVPDAVTGGLSTVGLRVPRHPVALAVLRDLGRPLAAPSANRFGRVSPTRREHVIKDLGSEVELVLEGGSCEVGVESTIVDLTGDVPRLLRPGSVTVEDMASRASVFVQGDDGTSPAAPGTLPSHYAPRARVLVRESTQVWQCARELTGEGLVGVLVQTEPPRKCAEGILVRRISGGPRELAQRLYESLRSLDEAGCSVIVAARPSADGVGHAVSDRLLRAAVGRVQSGSEGRRGSDV